VKSTSGHHPGDDTTRGCVVPEQGIITNFRPIAWKTMSHGERLHPNANSESGSTNALGFLRHQHGLRFRREASTQKQTFLNGLCQQRLKQCAINVRKIVATTTCISEHCYTHVSYCLFRDVVNHDAINILSSLLMHYCGFKISSPCILAFAATDYITPPIPPQGPFPCAVPKKGPRCFQLKVPSMVT
jgi:hypothetical protein